MEFMEVKQYIAYESRHQHGAINHFFDVHFDPWENDPIWLIHMFHMDWNHQLVYL